MLLVQASDEISALAALYAYWSNASQPAHGWMGSEPPRTWSHLQCDAANASIISVDIPLYDGARGTIPTQLAKLSLLTRLALQGAISGTMPTELALLTNMRSIVAEHVTKMIAN